MSSLVIDSDGLYVVDEPRQQVVVQQKPAKTLVRKEGVDKSAGQQEQPLKQRLRIQFPIDYSDTFDSGLITARYHQILYALHERPFNANQLTELVGLVDHKSILPYLNFMVKHEIAEQIPSTGSVGLTYYRITDKYFRKHRSAGYPDFSAVTNILQLPEYAFYLIPTIAYWVGRIKDRDNWQKQLLTHFRDVCYGQVAPSFTSHPNDWTTVTYPNLVSRFVKAYLYDNQDREGIPASIILCIKTFLHVCLKIKLTTKQAEDLGLVTGGYDGQYKAVELTADEIEKAKDWLSTKGVELAESVGMEGDRLLAHFAFSMESCNRPSQVLIIETAKVSVVAGDHLQWNQIETKRRELHQKMMKDKELVAWASAWVDKRIESGYRYLFVDSNAHVAEYDSQRLKPIRSKYIAIYRELFKYLGKSEDLFFERTLYVFRHLSTKWWIARGASIDTLQSMGWKDVFVLREYYGINADGQQ